jgi:hypothetical protein
LRSAPALAKAGPKSPRWARESAMVAILMIFIFLGALVALNIKEHGRAD